MTIAAAALICSLMVPPLIRASPVTVLSGMIERSPENTVSSSSEPEQWLGSSYVPTKSTHNSRTLAIGFTASTGFIHTTLPRNAHSTGDYLSSSQVAATAAFGDSSQSSAGDYSGISQASATGPPSDASQSSDSFDSSFQPSEDSNESSQSSAGDYSSSPQASATDVPSDSSESPQSTSNAQSSPSTAADSSVFNPPWSSVNITCDDFQLLIAENPADAWSAVHGDETIQTFNQMYAENQRVCQACYGISDPTKCDSNDPTCVDGLQKMNGTTTRQDTAASIFSQMGPDFACILDPAGGCSAYPQCLDQHGPAGYAIMTSLVSMHNSLENVYDALEAARSSATDQMGLFSQVFAPVPSLKNKSIWMEIMFVIAGLVAGIVPGLGETVTPLLLGTATAGGLLIGVGSAVVMDDMIFDQPTAADTASHLDTITNNIREAYSDVATSLFQNGSYDMPIGDDQGTKTQTWGDIMAGGALLQQSVNATDELQLVYERVLYQQLAVYTWQNLEVGDAGHLPFIAFENTTCDQIDPSRAFLDTIIAGVSQSDTNITYNGSCYYLLDGTTSKVRTGHGGNVCTGKPLPGGTNKNMIKNTVQFANLTLADFVIPSVKGWQNHTYQNGYESLETKGSIFTDPQAAGVVNLPICDYMGSPDSPGIGCPKLQNTMPSMSKSCEIYPASMGTNQPGQFVDGSCGVHVKQWQKTEGDENPLGSYQLSITVLDGAGRPVGEATKQSAAQTLEVVDSALPYDLIVATGDVDSAPILFWYSDQYWNSSSMGTGSVTNHCAVGAYDHGVRQMDCGFSCPFPDPSDDPPASATIDNPFPNTPVPAVGGDTTFSNQFTISRPAAPTASVEPYPTGRCGVEIRQYQRNEGNSSMNDTPNYKIEVTLKGGDMKPIGGPEALQPAPSGQPISIPGLVSPFTVTVGGADSDPLTITFAGKTWQTNSSGRTCNVGGFKDGYRDLDCRFDC